MKFTISWLKKFLDTDASLEKITNTLTMSGLEVEDIDDRASKLKNFEVAKILEAKQHPEVDKLKLCKVQSKSEILQIVCAASNARPGIKVVLAKIGTMIPKGNFKIKKSKIRGVESYGMMCSCHELNIGQDADGIIELASSAIVGDEVAKYLGVDDPVIHINITPNRADALGVYGIARDLAASGIGKLKILEVPKIEEAFETNYNLSIKDDQACPLFAIREIKNLDNKGSPEWLKNLLDNIGVGSISTFVDITNYISYTFGQPVHAYDADKIKDGLLIEKLNANIGFKALNDKEYILKDCDIVLRDSNEIHCLTGIIGGKNSSCSEDTNRVILEVANFNADNIARTGRRLMVDTDSRYRFERNVDREFTLKALDFATDLIISICGGSASKAVVVGDSGLPVRTIDFPLSFLKSRTNIDLSSDEICTILKKLGFICKMGADFISITIPSWRYDVSLKEDIVEEIVRIYGYDNLPETPLPEISISKIIPRDQRKISDIKRIFASAGYKEVVTWSFMDSKKAELFSSLKEELTLLNPISSDLDYMRPSILPNLLQLTHNNINRSFHDLSLFEVGPVFNDTGHEVKINVSGIRVGQNISKNSHDPSRLFDVFDIKADITNIFKYLRLDFKKCQIRDNVPGYYHPTRSASLCLGENILGYFGQVHPNILKCFDIDLDVMGFELNISALPVSKEKYGKKAKFITSNYQGIRRDYVFILDKNQKIGELLNFIRNTDKKRIRSVNLFDIYYGKKIDNTKKSIALSVSIRDDNKTLEKADIEIISKTIIDGIQQNFNAILRDN